MGESMDRNQLNQLLLRGQTLEVGFALVCADKVLEQRQKDIQTVRDNRNWLRRQLSVEDEFLEETQLDIQMARDVIAIAVGGGAGALTDGNGSSRDG